MAFVSFLNTTNTDSAEKYGVNPLNRPMTSKFPDFDSKPQGIFLNQILIFIVRKSWHDSMIARDHFYVELAPLEPSSESCTTRNAIFLGGIHIIFQTLYHSSISKVTEEQL